MLSKIWLSGTCLSLGLLLPACSQTWVRREPETGFHAYLDGSSVDASTQLDWYRGGYEYRFSYGNRKRRRSRGQDFLVGPQEVSHGKHNLSST